MFKPRTNKGEMYPACQRRCSEDGCSNVVYSHGKCKRHGKARRCSEDGCSNIVVSKGKCKRHGKVKCSEDGCLSVAYKNGKINGKCSEVP